MRPDYSRAKVESEPRPRGPSAALLGLLCLAIAAPCFGQPAPVTGDDVRKAIRDGVRAIKARQQPDGSWTEHFYPGGETALCVLALLQAGEPPDSPAILAALPHIVEIPNQHTYAVGLKAMAMAAVDPKRHRAEIQAAARWLSDAQTEFGLWNYTPAGSRWDLSNSQFALLGLHAASQSGAKIAAAVWQKAQAALLRVQNRDGGWAYQQSGASYGSMTAAAVAGLYVCGTTLAVGRERGFNDGAAPNCGKYRANAPLANGLSWLGRNFIADENPGKGRAYTYYWLYAIERCGILSGQRYFGRHDWYREGAEFLVRSQNGDGTWGNEPANTAFGVLFLAKGHKPLLIQKLQWATGSDWNLDRNDLAHLTSFIDDKLGEPVAWQTVPFEAPLEEWLTAPILYFQGHEFPQWNDEQRAKLRAYVERGGTLLAEACCGRDEFRAGFAEFAVATFPEHALRELGAEHGVYHALFDVEPAGIMGMDLGCRTSVLYLPNDLSCLWEQTSIPILSERALRLGANIAAYATGRQALRDRLDIVTLPAEEAAADEGTEREALRLAQVVYDGDWRPDPHALVHFAEFLRDNLRLDVVTRYRAVRLTEAELSSSPLLYMSGHHGFALTEPERQALATHLRRGGFLLADACCGRDEFDAAFRGLAKSLFVDAKLERLPPDHAIYRGQPGFVLATVTYKEPVTAVRPGLDRPELWGLELDGRLVVVYSPYAIGCGMDGHTCFDCRGLQDLDARRLAANVVLYAMTH